MRSRGRSAEPSGQAHSRRKGSWCRGPEPTGGREVSMAGAEGLRRDR